jgi:hypothetical protein
MHIQFSKGNIIQNAQYSNLNYFAIGVLYFCEEHYCLPLFPQMNVSPNWIQWQIGNNPVTGTLSSQRWTVYKTLKVLIFFCYRSCMFFLKTALYSILAKINVLPNWKMWLIQHNPVICPHSSHKGTLYKTFRILTLVVYYTRYMFEFNTTV